MSNFHGLLWALFIVIILDRMHFHNFWCSTNFSVPGGWSMSMRTYIPHDFNFKSFWLQEVLWFGVWCISLLQMFDTAYLSKTSRNLVCDSAHRYHDFENCFLWNLRIERKSWLYFYFILFCSGRLWSWIHHTSKNLFNTACMMILSFAWCSLRYTHSLIT